MRSLFGRAPLEHKDVPQEKEEEDLHLEPAKQTVQLCQG